MINVTFDTRMFEQIGTPEMNKNYVWGGESLPNIEYNKVYYRLDGNKLIAFKVLASALNNGHNFVHLVQEVGKSPMWSKYFNVDNKIIFENVDDVFRHAETGVGGINVFEGKSIKHIIPVGYINSDENIKFKKTYYWCNHTNKVCMRHTDIKYVLINGDGIFFGLSLRDGEFTSKADVIKSRFDGLEIMYFPPTDFDINIKVEVSPSKPIVRTLTITEE